MLTKKHTGHEQTIKVFVPIAYFMRFIADVHIKANLDRFHVLIIKAKVRRLFHLTWYIRTRHRGGIGRRPTRVRGRWLIDNPAHATCKSSPVPIKQEVLT